MKTDLARRMAALPPAVRRVTLDLGASKTEVLRRQARARLACLALPERGGMNLDTGEKLVADLANEIFWIRLDRRTRHLNVTPRTSPIAAQRDYLARRLQAPIRLRSNYRNRALIKLAARDVIPHWATDPDSLLVYETEHGEAHVRVRRTCKLNGGRVRNYYDLHVPVGWRRQTRCIGDGSGTVAGMLILSAYPVGGDGTADTIQELVVAGVWAEALEARYVYLCSSPTGQTLHPSFRTALDALASSGPTGRGHPAPDLRLVA